MKNFFLRLKKFKPLLKELVKRDIKVRYRHSVLGIVWTVLNPLLMMIVMAVVFSNLFKGSVDNFPVYVMVGNIVFSSNSASTMQGMSSIIWNASLIKKVYIPKYLFPLSNVLSCLINFGFSFIALIFVMIFTGAEFHITIITIWIPLLYLTIFSFGLSLILCTINIFFRDMEYFYGVFTSVWMYLSAIFYTIDILPKGLQNVVLYNPLYQYITFFRKIVIDGVYPGLLDNIVCMGYAIVTLLIGILIFNKKQDKFILHI